MSGPVGFARRTWFAPEVVQTSSMDCGPAALKCLLEGFGISASYGRLREACQTDVDGTSIDTLEVVANELGIRADQIMIPIEHVLLDASNLPALAVVRHADGPAHFVVAWRKVGRWLQIMDPAVGRRWARCDHFTHELVRHETSVPASAWRSWADSGEFLTPLSQRLAALGTPARTIAALTAHALSDAGWFTLGALDASTRLVTAIVTAGGLTPGREAVRLLTALFKQTCESPLDIFTLISPAYWSVCPDPDGPDRSQQHLLLKGAVLMRVPGRVVEPGSVWGTTRHHGADRLSPELVAALTERPVHVMGSLWGFLRVDGLLAPLALTGAVGIAACVAMVEALLFRGIFDIGSLLPIGSQRLVAVAGLIAFMAVALAFRIPIISEAQRMGRRLDTRLRMALLSKLPRLTDRYFHSRPISDLADRSHSIRLTRLVPGMGLHFVQAACELLLTLAGILLLDPASAPVALGLAGVSVVVPALFQPVINERDLRVRNHGGALGRFYLDALIGLVPIRTHRAEAAVRHQHQSLLVEWARSSHRVIRAAICAGGVQSTLGTGLAGLLLVRHFLRADGVTGADLLLIYWALKLPAIGGTLTALAHQYPMQRNVLLRLLEPLGAPEQTASAGTRSADVRRVVPPSPSPTAGASRPTPSSHGVAITIDEGTVVAAGHAILEQVSLHIRPGEHLAIVGLSGAGKSTLLGLLLGWHRLASGQITVDGNALNDQALDTLRRRTAWVDPAVQVWNRSFLDNINYSSREPDALRAAAAIDAAQLRGVLQRLPEGLQTSLGEGGALMSGGEGQRVRLARALAQPDVALALLDEPFRGMDREQRATLLTTARRHWQDATLLCVTHDVSETLAFDRVLVIEGGHIIEDGAPACLAAVSSRYRALLDAETRVRERMWKGGHWRRVRVEQGAIVQAAVGHAAGHADAVGQAIGTRHSW